MKWFKNFQAKVDDLQPAACTAKSTGNENCDKDKQTLKFKSPVQYLFTVKNDLEIPIVSVCVPKVYQVKEYDREKKDVMLVF